MYKSNATLIFKIAQAGEVKRDPVTGSPVQAMATSTVLASMESVSNSNKSVLPGVDESAMYLEGRAVNPKHLTDAIKVNKVADMTLERGLNTKLQGKFHLLPSSSSRLGLDFYFGDFIQGYFQVGV